MLFPRNLFGGALFGGNLFLGLLYRSAGVPEPADAVPRGWLADPDTGWLAAEGG